MLVDVLTIFSGVVGMLFLAEVIVRKAMELARYLGLSGSFIGLTVLSIGTSVPEIMSHIVGSVEILVRPETMHSISGLLIGTNIGSDIFQQNFILPVVGLLGTVTVLRSRLHDVMGGLLGAALLAWIFCLGGQISRLEGAILLLGYFGYLLFLLQRDTGASEMNDIDVASINGRTASLSFILILICFAIMALITEHVVNASTAVVAQLPISASFFGVIFLGVSTSLPELMTALVSMYKGKTDISVGIMLGSNVTNPMFGIGLGALISTYTVPDVIVFYDLPVNIVTALILYYFLIRREDLNKNEALILLASFFIYLSARWMFFPEDFPVTV